jgi:hypothetical protein
MIRMDARLNHKDRFAGLKMLLAIAVLVCVAIYCVYHPGEWWRVLLKASFSPL